MIDYFVNYFGLTDFGRMMLEGFFPLLYLLIILLFVTVIVRTCWRRR